MFTFMLVFLWCCTRSVESSAEVRICSDYLVSGLHGVDDVSLSASTVWEEPLISFGPENARLYYPGDLSVSPKGRSGCWAAGVLNTNQYIQVTFPVKTNVMSVTLHNFDLQYVTSYYLLYSMDDVTWSTVTSSDGSLKLFTGSADRHTPATSYVTPSITALHIRINPQSWRGHIIMRFDVGGCQTQTRKLKRGRNNFARKFVNPTEDMRGSHLVTEHLTSQSECAKICHKNNACMAFTYQTETQFCTGYGVWNVVQGNISNPQAAFVNLDFFDVYGYKVEQDINMLYNVNELKATKMDASATCTSQGTQLIAIDTEAKMTKLWTYINGVRVLQQNYGMYVSGTYKSGGLWLYESTGTVINSALWSPNTPDSSKGPCVMLTQTGLASVDCGQTLLSICGY